MGWHKTRRRLSGGRRSGVRPLAAAGLSAVWPGAGQWAVGRRARGAVMAVAAALLAGTVAVLAWWVLADSGPDVLGWALTQQGILVLVAVNVAVGAFRVVVAMDAWAAARRGGREAGGWQIAGLVVLLVTVVLGPHVLVAAAGAEARRVIDAVFVEEAEPGHADTAQAPDPPPEPADERGADPKDDDEDAEPDWDPGLEPSEDVRGPVLDQDPAPQGFGDRERLTVLLLGSDAGPGRSGTRVDVMVVATIDLASSDVVLISVPRNLADVPMPEGLFADRLGDRYPQRLMSLYPQAAGDEQLAAAYDDPGKEAHVVAVQTLLGLRIDHVAMVDMAGFVDVIDAFGGVDVDVSDPIHVRLSPPTPGEDWRTYDIPAGPQRLDGHSAHAYVRSRTGTDDYDRMRRQRCLVGSVVGQVGTVSLLRALPSLADVLVERVQTDIPVDMLPDLARLAGRVDVAGLRTLGITPPTYTDGQNAHGFFSADVPYIQQAVRDLLDGAEAAPAGASDLAGTCG